MNSSHTSAKLSNSQTIGGMISEATPIVIVIGLGILGLQPFGIGSPYLSAIIVMLNGRIFPPRFGGYGKRWQM